LIQIEIRRDWQAAVIPTAPSCVGQPALLPQAFAIERWTPIHGEIRWTLDDLR